MSCICHLIRLTAGAILATAVTGQTPTPLETELFGTFQRPIELLSPPDDIERVFVVEQSGSVQVHKNGSVLATPFLDLSALVATGGEQGLLGAAFHPDYSTNGYLYVGYVEAGTAATVIERYSAQSANPDLADPNSALRILTVPQPNVTHNGGSMAFGPDGLLYIAMGDGGGANDPQGNGQNTNVLLGKMLRIDVDNPGGGLPYGIPAGNPFAGTTAGRAEILMIGLRNPWKISFDRLTGDLYIADVGQNAQEEIDFVPAASLLSPGSPATVTNFGWRCMEGTHCTGLTGCTCNAPSLTLPVHTFPTSSSAAIGGHVYRGCAIPDLRGTYFFAEYGGADQIWSLRVAGGQVTGLTTRTSELDPPGSNSIHNIASFGVDACGELYILELSGQIWKIVPTSPVPTTGLLAFGTGTPGCNGQHTLAANCPATLLNPTWHLTSTNAPPSSIGMAVLAAQPDVQGSDPFGIGVVVHVSLATAVLSWLAQSDASGVGTSNFAIPNIPAIVGWQVHLQVLWLWPSATCQPTPFGVSSTPGLSVTFLQ